MNLSIPSGCTSVILWSPQYTVTNITVASALQDNQTLPSCQDLSDLAYESESFDGYGNVIYLGSHDCDTSMPSACCSLHRELDSLLCRTNCAVASQKYNLGTMFSSFS